ncbi:MAG: hypothetical protein ACAH80_08035 [Alphaproteobacteria bacterium]
MKISKIIGFVVTFGIICMMFLSVTSSNKQIGETIKSDPQYNAYRDEMIRAGVNPDDPKAVEAYLTKMAKDIEKSQQMPEGAAKE